MSQDAITLCRQERIHINFFEAEWNLKKVKNDRNEEAKLITFRTQGKWRQRWF